MQCKINESRNAFPIFHESSHDSDSDEKNGKLNLNGEAGGRRQWGWEIIFRCHRLGLCTRCRLQSQNFNSNDNDDALKLLILSPHRLYKIKFQISYTLVVVVLPVFCTPSHYVHSHTLCRERESGKWRKAKHGKAIHFNLNMPSSSSVPSPPLSLLKWTFPFFFF